MQLRSLSWKVTLGLCQEKEEEEEEEVTREANKKKEATTETMNGQVVKSRVAAVESNKMSSSVGSPEFSPARGTVASQSRHGGLKHSDSR